MLIWKMSTQDFFDVAIFKLVDAIFVCMKKWKLSSRMIFFSVNAVTANAPALEAGGDLKPQNCHAKQMQFRI